MGSKFDPRETPWQIDESEFRSLRTDVERIKFLLRYAVLAPSGHNTQPWRFEVSRRGVRIYADYQRQLTHTDPDHREMLMSIAAAIFNLRVAAAHFGYHCAVMYTPRPGSRDAIAGVDLWEALDTERIDEELKPLFPAIMLRHTNRRTFEPKPLSDADVEAINKIGRDPRATFRLVTSPRVRSEVAQLIAVGDRIQSSDPEYRKELSSWVRSNASSEADGLPTDAVGIPQFLGPTAGWFMRHFDFGASVATRDYQLTASAAGLVVIESEDDFQSLVAAGELLERLLLTLTMRGLQYSLVNQTVQVTGLRSQLRRLTGLTAQPQLVLRVGYGDAVQRPAPRRPVDEVVRITR